MQNLAQLDAIQKLAMKCGYVRRHCPGEVVFVGGVWKKFLLRLKTRGFQKRPWPVKDGRQPTSWYKKGSVEVSRWDDGIVRIPMY